MGAISEEHLMNYDKFQGMGDGGDEKILVLVRLRPLSEKELARNEVADWECINSSTILYRNSLQERTGFPTTYSFDRVFRGDCATREVYEQGTKDIALSVVGGINSTIFAYGQTSSGKTYTMNGITEYTVADIYECIQKHEERAFVLKFSAMEIYNEVVRDLLSTDNIQLRLLDDPERGTIVEKLTEATLRDWKHLTELLSICEAQRKVGETLLNETSSRSHQILRLTIESSAHEFLGKGNSTSLAASVNFVDLAGSERASQALSAGQRLKEGCHINRSLLTLGTVIRKLSKGRHGHVNYRDSKLTRILQPALGGNARTAIICTLSPARAHVEQSRNTLLFASCAKEVSTNAQVNVVLSDKALVKQLQKEVARLESELRTPGSICDHLPLLRKKDLQIEKLEKEIRELKKQREIDHSRIQKLLQDTENTQNSQKIHTIQPVMGDFRNNRRSDLLTDNNYCSSDDVSDPIRGLQELSSKAGEDCDDDICREVRCVEIHESGQREPFQSYGLSSDDTEETMPPLLGTRNAPVNQEIPIIPRQFNDSEHIHSYGTLQQSIQNIQNSFDSLVRCHPDASSPGASSSVVRGSRSLKLTRSQSCRENLMNGSHNFEMAVQSESTPPSVLEPEVGFFRKQWKLPPVIYGADSARLCRNDSQSSDCSSFIDEMKNQNGLSGDEDIPTLGSFVAGLREMAKLQYESRTWDQVGETGKIDENNATDVGFESVQDWPLKFAKLQKSIIELWKTCNVSLVHRTYFVLLIKDDLADSIYMKVEHRRLAFLKETFAKGNSAVQNGRTLTLASSKRALRREREMLSRLMNKRYTEEERNELYEEWDINLSSKRRRLQLIHKLWSDSGNMSHIKKSAAIVAKLIGFSDHDQALKEMFGLSFTPPARRRSFGWKSSRFS